MKAPIVSLYRVLGFLLDNNYIGVTLFHFKQLSDDRLILRN